MERFILAAIIIWIVMALAYSAHAQVPVTVMPVPKAQFFDNSGVPLANGCLVTYAAGSTTPLATYTDYTGTVQNATTIDLDSAGRANVWLAGSSYKFVLKSSGGSHCASGSTIWTVDGVDGVYLDFCGLSGCTFTGDVLGPSFGQVRYTDQFASITSAYSDAGTTGGVIINSGSSGNPPTNSNALSVLDFRPSSGMFYSGKYNDVSDLRGNMCFGLSCPNTWNASHSGNVGMGVGLFNALTTADNNTGMGDHVLQLATSGTSNAAFGRASLSHLTTGNYNSALGHASGFSSTTGGFNIFIGDEAGYTATPANANTTDSYTIAIGFEAGRGDATPRDNWAAIGKGALATCSNCMVLGSVGSNAIKVGLGNQAPAYTFHQTANIDKSTVSLTDMSFWGTNDGSAPFGLKLSISGQSVENTRRIEFATTEPGNANGGGLVLQPDAGWVDIGSRSTCATVLCITGTATVSSQVTAATFGTATNCAAVGTGANPSLVACAAAASGSFSCATAATGGTCVVSTTAVTANSVILITEDDSLGTKLSVTCNTGTTVLPVHMIAARSAGVSFTINLGTVTTNPACFNYLIVN